MNSIAFQYSKAFMFALYLPFYQAPRIADTFLQLVAMNEVNIGQRIYISILFSLNFYLFSSLLSNVNKGKDIESGKISAIQGISTVKP